MRTDPALEANILRRLRDPLVRLVMASDGVTEAEVFDAFAAAKAREAADQRDVGWLGAFARPAFTPPPC